jgi:undecaprenyl-diphosphatase
MDFSIINELFLTILVGITQGLTEFLPISSTAHIRLITSILAKGRDIGLNSSNIIQLGTLFATLQFFNKELSGIWGRIKEISTSTDSFNNFSKNFTSWRKNQKNFLGNQKQIENDILISQLIIGTLPIILFALLLNNFVDSTRSLNYILSFLIAGSGLMALAEFIYKKNSKLPKNTTNTTLLSLIEVLLIGMFQSLAIFPGISRSGATISGALMVGKPRSIAVRFSFLLSIPAIMLSGLFDSIKYIIFSIKNPNFLPVANFWTDSKINLSLSSIIIATFFAYIVGYICLRWLLSYLSNHTVKSFIIYRLLLAFVIFIYVFIINPS